MGNVIQAGVKMNPARQAAIHAGLPVTVPAMTVNRVCGSGAQAVVSAAQEILLGTTDVALAGGMENMDLAPYLMPRGRWGYRMGDGTLYDSMLRDGLKMPTLTRHRAGTRKIWSRSFRSVATYRINGRCDRSSDSPLLKPRANLKTKSSRSTYPAAQGRLSLIGMSITGRKRLWRHWLRSSRLSNGWDDYRRQRAWHQ